MKVAEQLPSIQDLLEDAQSTKGENDEVWKTTATEVRTCEAACKALRIIFDKACPKEDSSRGRRAWNASAVIFTGKRTEAEGHLAVILQTLDVFRAKLMITNTKLLEDLKKAVDDFEKDEGGITHYGSGDIMSSGGGTFNLQKGDNTTFFANVGTYNAPALAPARRSLVAAEDQQPVRTVQKRDLGTETSAD
ncbi:hypothetical protein KC332_g14886 [Hortaea werneckii]|nr:hypothetical protein KC350_g14610 [Hortaea werneckii]KAI6966055.1 hypothetical protein KC329_g15006 [Hortaea werneckii]KAI7260454.1 hypothetical protein KC335_g11208 [Hortaea werneckii]KAI7387517.1 hypothetical protein KC332_g14886 [Hortaea werneckii]KAI7393625.1 hypothetical protein KC336_g16269 [Hortaea werneckii]